MSTKHTILHGVEPFMQPSPSRNPGGDCFACAVTATMRYFFPDNPPSFDTCWECFEWDTPTPSGSQRHLHNDWRGMRQALYNLFDHGYKLDIVADVVQPQVDPERYSHTWGPSVGFMDWGRRLEGWLASGYVALAEVRFEPSPTGEWQSDGAGSAHRQSNDHFVVLDGVRYGWRKSPNFSGAWSGVYQVHVVCSARGAYWIDAEKLMREHGTMAWWLVRPRAEWLDID